MAGMSVEKTELAEILIKPPRGGPIMLPILSVQIFLNRSSRFDSKCPSEAKSL
jgi:hypothetical protein